MLVKAGEMSGIAPPATLALRQHGSSLLSSLRPATLSMTLAVYSLPHSRFKPQSCIVLSTSITSTLEESAVEPLSAFSVSLFSEQQLS